MPLSPTAKKQKKANLKDIRREIKMLYKSNGEHVKELANDPIYPEINRQKIDSNRLRIGALEKQEQQLVAELQAG